MSEIIFGMRDDLTNEAYHASPGYSSSNLGDLLSYSPQHMVYWKKNPVDATPSMLEGTYLHLAVLEPHLWEKQRDSVKPYLVERVEAMRDSVMANSTFKALFADALVERSIYWEDPRTGLLLKCRPDIINQKLGMMIDLKKTSDARPWAIKKSIREYNYHLQAAHHMTGLQTVMPEIKDSVFVFVENYEPYAVNIVALSLNDLDVGKQVMNKALDKIKECETNGFWPGYCEGIQELKVFEDSL